jgi:superfamily II RNA helicase
MHHAGLMPILREMTEILFAKGFIKLLFCTETMSVGINLPVKTTIFTDISKFNGNTMRMLYSHEYTQAAGRAGRLGLDTVGHVIHLNNLFRNVDHANYKDMMNGKPQTLTSKFKISYNLLLNLLDTGDKNIVEFANRSMVKGDIDSQLSGLNETIYKQNFEYNRLKSSCEQLTTPVETILKLKELEEIKPYTANKKRKEVEKQIQNILDTYKFIRSDIITYFKKVDKEKEINELQKQSENVSHYIESGAHNVLTLLEEDGYLEREEDSAEHSLTIKGQIAAQLKETHCLVFAQLIEDKILDELSSKQLTMLFSCFTNISVQDDYKDFTSEGIDDSQVKNILKIITNMYDDYQQKEIDYKIKSGIDYNMHYDLLVYLDEWCEAKSADQCKIILKQLSEEKGIFLGEFVKALLKINNISCEMEKVAEMTNNIAFLSKLREIPQMTLKYVVTNQSLYV